MTKAKIKTQKEKPKEVLLLAKRIKQLYKELLNIDINWVEATAIAGKRSANAIWSDHKLREVLAELRGVLK